MLNYISGKSVDFLINREVISTERKAVFVYGFQVLYSNVMCFCSLLFLGWMQKKEVETLLFTLFFMVVRVRVGGYHARTYLGCYLTTLMFFEIYIWLSQILERDFRIQLLVFAMSFLGIWVKSPVESSHRPKTEYQKKMDNKKSKACLIMVGSILLILSILCEWKYFANIASCFLVIFGMMLISIIFRNSE